MEKKYFKGLERIETFPVLGYPTRMGGTKELEVSDLTRLSESLESEDRELSLQYLDMFYPQHLGMTRVLLEWSLMYSSTFHAIDSEKEAEITKKVHDEFVKETKNLKKDELSSDLVEQVLLFFSNLSVGELQDFAKRKETNEDIKYYPFISGLETQYQNLHLSISNKNFDDAKIKAKEYFSYACTLHDTLVNYTSTYPNLVRREEGQKISEKLIQDSFSGSSFHVGLWTVPTLLDSEGLTAFLAEHLRYHFSGENRDGSTQIIEEKDRYRIVFPPCGSGGALRRRLGDYFEGENLMPDSSPMTWQREGEVPAYCTHCAFNEITSINKFGYPILVTEFSTDANEPCGWTVYKDPNDIPEEVFERVGEKKEPSKFKKLPFG